MTLNLTDEDKATLFQEIESHLASVFAPAQTASVVSALDGWKKKMMADGSFGRVFNGPQWLDGIAIRDGVVSGKKLQAQLVISNLFTTVDETLTPTADRGNFDATSLRYYGTVSGTPNTKIAEVGPTGFTFGPAGNQISYVASTGVLAVPAAVITSLTIANVGAGIIGGLYKTSASNAHLELDTSGIRMYDSGAVKTFDAVASSGALNLTGSLTIGTGGKINFGVGPDYLDNNLLHFEVGSSEYGKVEFRNGSVTPRGRFAGSSSSAGATASMYTNYDGTFNGAGQISVAPNTESFLQVGTSSTGASAIMSATITTAAGRAKVTASGATTVANTYVEMLAGTYGKLYIDTDPTSAFGRVQVTGRLYPGSDTGAQTARYIYDNGTQLVINGPMALASGEANNTATGALPAATKWIRFYTFAGTAYYVPAYSFFANWAA